ncbi:Phosphoglycerate transporter [Aeromicrobium sp. 9AM]|nr:Phosphoglycerate transporter [Aeromicrobium sp. 9AM]
MGLNEPVPLAGIEELAVRIAALRRSQARTVVAISGYGGAGKSTLTKTLAAEPGWTRLRGDDFLDPMRSHLRSTDWDGVERTRLRDEVLAPFRRGEQVRFRPFDWSTGRLGSVTELPDTEALLVDAIGILHPELEGCFDLSVWVDVDLETAGERGRERDRRNGSQHDELWIDVWLPNDRDFAARFDPMSRADVRYVPADVAQLGMPNA